MQPICGPARVLAPLLLLLLAACDRNSGDAAPESSAAPAGSAATPLPEPAFVGGGRCAECHADEVARFLGSHHDLAMQSVAADNVLGDFTDAVFEGEVETRFFRRGEEFWVTTEGADGEPADFEVVWTFGVEPLQQYLVALPDGKVQALNVAWDSRPAEQGGQRWFDLYPDEVIDYSDPLHWTGVYQRWNTNCADCHSTELVKDFDLGSGSFDTRFTSIDVDCEGCHGPSSNHVADPAVPPPALAAVPRRWVFADGESIATREPDAPGPAEIEVCAQCHSRRSQLSDDYEPGDSLWDAYRPVWLEPGLYHADGQILDEVYVYGSFVQSAMAAAGVTCTDCHDPHTAKLRVEGNAVCGQCHLASTYDQPSHHRHTAGTEGAQCTSCHMRAETYMVVDPRRDHSFRVPRPDLSARLDSPNACNDCHDDRSSEWAAERVAEWYPQGRQNEPHFGEALQAGRGWAADARRLLLALSEDEAQPAIARATAINLMVDRLAASDTAWIERQLERDEPLVQLAAISAAQRVEPARRAELLQRFLTADTLALRIAAARALLPARAALSERRQRDLDAAIAEYLEVQAFNGDRPEGLLNAAAVAVEQGRYPEGEAIYREAIEAYPWYGALYVNLSDLYRLAQRDQDSLAILREGVAQSPDDPSIEFALALALVRVGEREEALARLAGIVETAPDEPYYAYVLAIAENDAGQTESALERLRATQERFPGYPDTLFALATILRDRGEIAEARGYAERLVALRPGDPNVLALRAMLGQGQQ